MLPRLLVSTVLFSIVGAQCPVGTNYDSSFQKCYQFVSTPTDFLTAEFNCWSIGGHLVTVGSGFENSYVSGMASGRGNPWIGYSYLQRSQWSWTSGSNSTFSNFVNGQPADPSAYQCASLKSTDNTWLKEMCSANRPYVCEVSPNATVGPSCPSPATTASPGGPITCSTGYTIYTGSNGKSMCYKVDSEPVQDWHYAMAFCALDGGVLPKIEDSGTNAFLLALAEENTVYHAMWIGLVCPTRSTTDCYWISDNSTLGSYQPWASGWKPTGTYSNTYMQTSEYDAIDGTWVSGWGYISTFCQKDPVPVSQFVEEGRQKRAAQKKEKKMGEKVLSDLKQ